MQTIKPSKYSWYLDIFHYIWFIDSENLCVILILKENGNVLIFNIVHLS